MIISGLYLESGGRYYIPRTFKSVGTIKNIYLCIYIYLKIFDVLNICGKLSLVVIYIIQNLDFYFF